MLSSISPVTYRNFPLRLYQVAPKFRDEMKPRFGLIRAKEFLMKDMYTFDLNLEEAQKTYEQVNEQYAKFFKHLNVPFEKIQADVGSMGGNTSHEYQILTSIGEDQIVKCSACLKAVNKELCIGEGKICEKCDKASLEHHMGIEIGHTFILGDKYSKALNATYLSKTGKPVILQMGCYGIGVTRLVAASIEQLSTEKEIRWPEALAPFQVCIIPPKEGSNEESLVKHSDEQIYKELESNVALRDEVVVDDRLNMTIGKRLRDTQKLGIPFVIVIGKEAAEMEPRLEIHHLNSNFSSHMTMSAVISHIATEIKKVNER